MIEAAVRTVVAASHPDYTFLVGESKDFVSAMATERLPAQCVFLSYEGFGRKEGESGYAGGETVAWEESYNLYIYNRDDSFTGGDPKAPLPAIGGALRVLRNTLEGVTYEDKGEGLTRRLKVSGGSGLSLSQALPVFMIELTAY